jgi:hypothetical protein
VKDCLDDSERLREGHATHIGTWYTWNLTTLKRRATERVHIWVVYERVSNGYMSTLVQQTVREFDEFDLPNFAKTFKLLDATLSRQSEIHCLHYCCHWRLYEAHTHRTKPKPSLVLCSCLGTVAGSK